MISSRLALAAFIIMASWCLNTTSASYTEGTRTKRRRVEGDVSMACQKIPTINILSSFYFTLLEELRTNGVTEVNSPIVNYAGGQYEYLSTEITRAFIQQFPRNLKTKIMSKSSDRQAFWGSIEESLKPICNGFRMERNLEVCAQHLSNFIRLFKTEVGQQRLVDFALPGGEVVVENRLQMLRFLHMMQYEPKFLHLLLCTGNTQMNLLGFFEQSTTHPAGSHSIPGFAYNPFHRLAGLYEEMKFLSDIAFSSTERLLTHMTNLGRAHGTAESLLSWSQVKRILENVEGTIGLRKLIAIFGSLSGMSSGKEVFVDSSVVFEHLSLVSLNINEQLLTLARSTSVSDKLTAHLLEVIRDMISEVQQRLPLLNLARVMQAFHQSPLYTLLGYFNQEYCVAVLLSAFLSAPFREFILDLVGGFVYAVNLQDYQDLRSISGLILDMHHELGSKYGIIA